MAPLPTLAILVVADVAADGTKSSSLPLVLEALAREASGRADVEVVLVDGRDGGSPVARPPGAPDRVRVVRAAGAHRGAMRNVALAQTTAPLVWWLGDDMVPGPGCLDAHLAAHAADGRGDLVVVGPAWFPPALRDDPFRRWLEDDGALFGVSFTRPDPRRDGFFYGANTSMSRAQLARAGPFRADFDGPVLDDDEMGRRLRALGARIVYVPEAFATHEHPVTWAERRASVRAHGRAAAVRDATADAPVRWPVDVTRSPAGLAWRAWVAALRARVLGGETRRAHAYRRRLQADFAAGYHGALRGPAT
ncbi:MAG: glycosyltransferase [Planctomycetota bacterium]